MGPVSAACKQPDVGELAAAHPLTPPSRAESSVSKVWSPHASLPTQMRFCVCVLSPSRYVSRSWSTRALTSSTTVLFFGPTARPVSISSFPHPKMEPELLASWLSMMNCTRIVLSKALQPVRTSPVSRDECLSAMKVVNSIETAERNEWSECEWSLLIFENIKDDKINWDTMISVLETCSPDDISSGCFEVLLEHRSWAAVGHLLSGHWENISSLKVIRVF
ncbi:hypothetical protein CALCODRAFT_226172 [Calocera cornea HHB12733]|uniref:Uncharacterized protein n=1 Tax=Calocera cornea HHB12733 TaxID=1353952 RepID=A0A165H150_9BASI|nr:hypothetical protein CALCODRAFT_226172 [Calocera cornea HHB12733]